MCILTLFVLHRHCGHIFPSFEVNARCGVATASNAHVCSGDPQLNYSIRLKRKDGSCGMCHDIATAAGRWTLQDWYEVSYWRRLIDYLQDVIVFLHHHRVLRLHHPTADCPSLHQLAIFQMTTREDFDHWVDLTDDIDQLKLCLDADVDPVDMEEFPDLDLFCDEYRTDIDDVAMPGGWPVDLLLPPGPRLPGLSDLPSPPCSSPPYPRRRVLPPRSYPGDHDPEERREGSPHAYLEHMVRVYETRADRPALHDWTENW